MRASCGDCEFFSVMDGYCSIHCTQCNPASEACGEFLRGDGDNYRQGGSGE